MERCSDSVCHFTEFVAHGFEFGKVFIGGIVATCIYYDITGGSYACKRVDMTVGIVTGELPVFKP